MASEFSYLFYRRPTSVVWTVSGTGAQFESDDRLSDGNPGVLTTLRWLSAGSPALGDYVALRGDWSTALQVRGAALQGLALEGGDFPAGVKFEVYGKRAGDPGYAYALGGNSLSEVSRELDDGSIGVFWLFDAGLTPLVGIEIRIFNDQAGNTWADADTYVRIGEADPFEGVPVCIAYGWRKQHEAKAEQARTLGAQLHEVDRVGWDALEFALAPAPGDVVRREGLATGEDWQRIEKVLGRAGTRAMVYVRTKDSDGVFSSEELFSTAIFGKAKPQPIVHVSRDYYSGGWRIEQVPPIV
jgi:hypothetical protein